MELPSPFAGVVRELLVQPGTTVPVGTPIIRVETAGDEDEVPPAPRRDAVLVGYGPSAPTVSRRRRPQPHVSRPPAVRSGAVHARRDAQDARETRTPIRGVRRATAAAMVASAAAAPHVTEFLTVDVTESVRLLERLRTAAAFDGLHVTPLTLVAKALLLTLRAHPSLNSAWDEAAQEIVTKHYVNLGIATATERGLMVPNVKDADRLPLSELCRAIGALTDTARAGRATPSDLTGGTITITNVGVYGIDTGTPILNPARPRSSRSARSRGGRGCGRRHRRAGCHDTRPHRRRHASSTANRRRGFLADLGATLTTGHLPPRRALNSLPSPAPRSLRSRAEGSLSSCQRTKGPFSCARDSVQRGTWTPRPRARAT